MRRYLRPLILAISTLLLLDVAVCPAETRAVFVLPAVGSINPGLAEFMISGIQQAEKQKAEALVIQLDTPGGLDSSMRQIVQAISNARVPVIVYVSPSGARAASAGVFITAAAQVAAMAPGTNIGAAHPVSIGMGKMDKTMEKKVLNDFVAYGRALTEERSRNPDWMEKAIRQSVSISASEALKLKVVDLLADNLNDLLTKVNGRRVLVHGQPWVLKTAGAPVKEIPEGLRTRLLKYIADPNIAFILMMIGLAGIYFELAHPGVVLPGVIGALCLLLAFFAFQTLPINYIGVLLILLAFVFFILEFKVTSYGLLSLGGVASLFLGAVMLFRGEGEGMDISWGVLIPTVLTVSLFFIAVAGIVFRSHFQRALTGTAGMVGERGVTVTPLAPEGQVYVHGEYWHAVSDEPIGPKEAIEILEVKDLKLRVRRAQNKF
ncbi:MAG: nodulation protein NfeD [Deltaproteobacteria bacterium]|nr:nodulation protein NfeD [Deltaproteobacteria bacterium]